MRRSSLVMVIAVIAVLTLLPTAVSAQYVGASKCKVCHLPQYKNWEQTKMSQGFELLKPGVRADVKRAHNIDPDKDYTNDPNCLSCHTTGYGQPGGFVSVAQTPNLVGVQCEVCHGPGGSYMKPNLMSLQNKEYKRGDLLAAGMVAPKAATCQQCHNKKSPFFKPFDFAERVKQGTHAHEVLKYKHD